jgi:hypothetical protein
MHKVLQIVLLLSCVLDVGCADGGQALLKAMLGSTQAAPPASGALRPGGQPSSALSSFDPLAANRSQPQNLVVANGPVQRSPGGFNPISQFNFPQQHPGGDLIASAPESFGGGPLGPGGNSFGGQLGGNAGFGSGM